MFIVYKSNNLDILLLQVYKIIKKNPLLNIFEKEIFIHDNKTVFQHLNIFFSNKMEISANFKLYHPDDFIWKLLQKILSKKITKNIFTHSIMTWKIMAILGEKKFEYFNTIKDKTKQFKFSFLMAKIFKTYLLYRPNWINEWEKSKNILKMSNNEEWQMKLWKKILHNYKKNDQFNHHFPYLFFHLQTLIDKKKIKQSLPHRCFVFSSFALNPSYIKIFKKISLYINIYFLYITPFKYKIFNIIKDDNKLKKDIPKKNNIFNNSLITLWSKYEKIYILHILISKQIKTINCFKINQNNNILNNIKNDFLNFNILKINKTKKKRFLHLTDNSISINICYDKKNEIEILHKTLLMFLLTDSKITPGDIVVTSFSMNSYISHINSIFTSINNKKQIPFFISTQFSKKTEIILSAFNKILNLPNSRFENQEILELLDIPEIAKNFNISEEEINVLYHWIEETNIRWGIDAAHKHDLSFPKDNQNTWFYGIEKLLLSYAINNTKKNWNNVLSSSLVNGSRAELVGKLIIFIKTLQKWQKKLSKLQCLNNWRSLSEDLINDFFYKSGRTEKSFQMIIRNWIEMIDDSLVANYTKKISINILKKTFLYKYKHINNQTFLPGVINFCHPYSIFYIPFKIICIIGFDYKSLPKENDLDDLNLLKKYSLIGDINIDQKCCYLFLQMLSCTKKNFYISYIGYSTKNEVESYPSYLVDQLLDYIALNFCFIEDQNLNIKNNKEKIISFICKKHAKQYFYEKKHIDYSIKESHQDEYQKIDSKIHNKNLCYKSSFKKKYFNKINLLELINFWKNPIQYFVNFNLKIKFDLKEHRINKTETFLVNKLDAFKMNNILLNKMINGQDITELLKYYKLSGTLPYNFFGKIFWQNNVEQMKKIAQSVLKYRIFSKEKKISLNVEQYQIHGVLSEIQSTGLLRWKPNSISYRDCMSLWLEHLIYSALGGMGESKIIGYKGQNWSFSSLNYNTACTYLLKYIEGYIEGMKQPLLLTKSGASWLDQVYDVKNNTIKNDNITKIKGYKKLLETWIGNNYVKGEKEDFYIKKIITNLDENNINKIYKTSQKWLIPILKNKRMTHEK